MPQWKGTISKADMMCLVVAQLRDRERTTFFFSLNILIFYLFNERLRDERC